MKTPFSFKLFIIGISTTLIILFTVTIVSANPAHRKYAVLTALPTILIFALSAIGIYSAATKKYETPREIKLNRIGLFGNIVICLFFLSIIVGGAMLAMR